jgi:hypothetical protein
MRCVARDLELKPAGREVDDLVEGFAVVEAVSVRFAVAWTVPAGGDCHTVMDRSN